MKLRYGWLLLLVLLAWQPFAKASDAPTSRWLVSPAISPDGSQIAFCYQGILFVVPSSGGEAKALTTSQAYAAHPVWSPDGKTLAYSSDNYGNFDIWTVSVQGGQPQRLTFNSTSEVPQAFTPNGDSIVMRAFYMPEASSGAMPAGWAVNFYTIPATGGAETLLLPMPGSNLSFTPDGKGFAFEDIKGSEDGLRKHHTSSVSRDIWFYNLADKALTHVIDRPGEDRNPVFSTDNDTFYFLSERNGGSFNVYKAKLSSPNTAVALTHFERTPVRNLTSSSNGMLCFLYDGEIWTMSSAGGEPKSVSISISQPNDEVPLRHITYRTRAHGGVISPDGKEVAFIVRGDVYVANIEHGTTKQITNTPSQERTVDFGKDGKSLIYDGERNGRWGLYIAKLADKDEKRLSLATKITEEPLLVNDHSNFQPVISPDGKEVAFLQDRTKIMIMDIKSKAVRQITDGSRNYSYADGDLGYSWSPDGKWLTFSYDPLKRWPNSDIGVISTSGKGKPHNITTSGYTDVMPKFAMNGDMIIWASDIRGMRAHASWGSQNDVYAFFTTKEAYDKFMMSEYESEELAKDAKKEEPKEDSKKKKKKGKKGKEDEAKDSVKPIKIDFHRPEDRIVRLTIHSSSLSDFFVTPDGKYLYYLTSFEGKDNLWKTDLKKKTTNQVVTLEVPGGSITSDKDGKNILVSSSGKLIKINLSSNKKETVAYAAPFTLQTPQERQYIFNHVWQQVKDKFYRSDLHGVDWNFYKNYYAKFLPSINNNYDFTNMLSEMLGELNASHTGSGYRGDSKEEETNTARLGIFYDRAYQGPGVKVSEILADGPFDLANSPVKAGTILTSIDGHPLSDYAHLDQLLDHKTGKRVRVEYKNGKTTGSQVVKPISIRAENELRYQRWIEQRRHEVDSLSNGRLGYVHIRGMNTASFHSLYSDLFGRYNDREGVVIDTRYNGGGHMHEDIEVLFSGNKYLDLVPREQMISEHPRKRWKKPSIMLVGEANYSNAHGTPWVYKTQGLGKLVGQPVPGTMTSVWWEWQIDPSIYFGVPIVGYIDKNGNYLENQQLEPDINVRLDYLKLNKGEDTQIQAAVKELLKEVDAEKGKSPWPAIDAKYSK